MPVSNQARSGHSQPAGQDHERGVHLVGPTTQYDTAGIRCQNITPRLTDWVPTVLEQLRPASIETVRTEAAHADAWRASTSILDETLPGWNAQDDTWGDATAEAVAYTQAITELALSEVDESTGSPCHVRRHESLIETVEAVGTGRGAVNAGLGALAKGPVALHQAFDPSPRAITLALDGPAWTDLTDRRTGVRALAAIAVLADGFDVRVVASPAVQRELARRYPRWSEIHLGLTHSRDRSPSQGHHGSDERDAVGDATQSVWGSLAELASAPGKRRLLGNLMPDQGRSYRDLKQDQAIDIEAGTVSRYVLDLEARGLVSVDRRGQRNTVRLSDRGATAVNQCLDAEYDLVHPDQRRLDEGLTDTPHDSTSTVSPRREATARKPSTAIDDWLASTGTPEGDAAFVQWLDSPDETLQNESLHRRFTIPARGSGITLVDDPVTGFDDSRVTYLSHHHDETLVIIEWGGALATLGRLAAVLLSEQALNKILTPSRVGHGFSAIHDGAFDTAAGRTLRRGHQVGWFSADEEQYAQWRTRIEQVRNELLARLSDHRGSTDTAARAALFEDLHGLIATATHLYHAAGVDLTITLRVPDTATVVGTERCRSELCEFLQHTVPKQSVYGIHSGYRLLFESRPKKLKRRLPPDVDDGDTLELTASWVIAGPTITELQSAITKALEQTNKNLRDTVADGTEQVPTLTIPVRDGTTYAAIRDVVETVAATTDTTWTAQTRQRLVRLLLRSCGPRDAPGHASPYDAAESLLRACHSEPSPTVEAVERAAASLPATRFRPDLPPTATKMYATLCRASQPLGRTEIIDRADISESSYDRRLDVVQAIPRVRPCSVSGYRRWRVLPNATAVPGASTTVSLPWWLSWPTTVSRLLPETGHHPRRWRLLLDCRPPNPIIPPRDCRSTRLSARSGISTPGQRQRGRSRTPWPRSVTRTTADCRLVPTPHPAQIPRRQGGPR
ncbi:transcriptional regulator [Halorubrum sp. SS7]|uniref:ArsR/SmtB family transcription factor n=2 Tax=unclassified Halorubrum TaxID=2642239 RepID=UPI0010F54BD5|nr:helix-turn-helix transcriptional regulator [Halorubrum sp. SS7]TKX57250.1 transcriptional regulator [Halorubrum sp. SS7]